MKIVVVGGTGLIGAKTVAILREGGHEVVAEYRWAIRGEVTRAIGQGASRPSQS